MIDVDVVLYSNGGADANAITEAGDSIYFGYAKNANIYRLRVHPTGIWEGCTWVTQLAFPYWRYCQLHLSA